MIVAAVLGPLEDLFRAALNWLHDSANLPWAWAIIALTVIVRVAIVPLAVKQIHSMQRLQVHAPEMKAIQKRWAHDKQRQQQEIMKFYRENNINPMASCWPMLAQIPVFFALYFVLKDLASDAQHGKLEGGLGWLGIFPNIADKITAHWSGWVLITIYVGSQLASSYFMSVSAQRSQRILMMFLPFMILPFILTANFPTGLVLYWATTNLWTVGQGLVTRTLIPKSAPPERRSSRTPAAAAREEAAAAAANAPGRTPQPPRRVKRKKGGRR